jgi:Peptidase family M28
MKKKNIIQAFLTLLVISVTVLVATTQTLPPKALPANAAISEFSAQRAIQHIQVLAQETRTFGEPGFEAARNYVINELKKLGLNSDTQHTKVTIPDDLLLELGPEIPPSMEVENLLTRIDGSSSQETVLLLSHLDSLGGPGASDDASGVAILLETARALLSGPPLRNTVILLFTAPEEYGAHGAVAFIREHPWAKNVKLVINLDAGGLSGPSELTNISPRNGWLVHSLAAGDPYAFGNSGYSEGKSEFTPFKFYGYSGYAFDFSRDFRVHTLFDNVENLNPPSIQQQGYHALFLTRYFGNLDSLQDPKEADLIFFSFLRMGLVYYPTSWVLPILLLVIIVFGCVVFLGFRRKYLTVSGIGQGALALVVPLIVAPLVVQLLWITITHTAPKFTWIYNGHPANASLLTLIFASVTIALVAAWYVLIPRIKKVSWPDLTIGALLLALIAGVVSTITSPKSSYSLTWSLLFSLLAAGFWFLKIQKENPESISMTAVLGLLLSAVMAISLILPGLYMSFTAAQVNKFTEPVVSLVLLLGLLVPQMLIITRLLRRQLPSTGR